MARKINTEKQLSSLTIKIPTELRLLLVDVCKSEDRTITAVIRRALESYLGGTPGISSSPPQ